MRELDEHGKAEDTEHDGWNRRQIGDVHLDQIGPAVGGGKLFQIDRCGHPDGQRQEQHHQHHEKRPQHRHPDPGLFGAGFGCIGASDEIHIEPLGDRACGHQLIDQIKMRRGQVGIIGKTFTRDPPLEVAIHPAGGEKVEHHRLTNLIRVGLHKSPQLPGGTRGQNLFQFVIGQVGHNCELGHFRDQSRLDQWRIAKGRDLGDGGRIAGACGVEHVGRQGHFQGDKGLAERAGAFADNGIEQRQKEDQANGKGPDAVSPKPGLGGVAPFGAGINVVK